MAITSISGAVLIESHAALNGTTRTVADGTTISAGNLLKLADPNTASASSGSNDIFGGVAMADKLADDGSTTLSADMSPGSVYLMWTADGPITAGEAVVTSGANLISGANVGDFPTGAIIGYAESDSAGGAGEQIPVRLK